jgi:hypothetical protein
MDATRRQVEAVLNGTMAYDDADGPAQDIVRDEWERLITERIAAADFTEELKASGLPWCEADADGNVIVHQPDRTRP